MKINVYGKTVPIFIENFESDSSHLDGYFDLDLYEIHINKKTKPKFWVFAHEMGHSLMHRLGFNYTSMPRDEQEIIVEGFATMLTENWAEICAIKKALDKKNK